MPKGKTKKNKEPFFKNFWNVILTIVTVILVFIILFREDEQGKTIAKRIFEVVARGDADDVIRQTVTQGIETITESCAKPPEAELEAFYNDKAGSLPVAQDFDADPGEICGNGKTWYCTSKPPKKPIPAGWEPPPRPGTDPNYQGPAFDAPFKESPYAMPSSKAILARYPIRDEGDPKLKTAVAAALKLAMGKVGYLGRRNPEDVMGGPSPRLVGLNPAVFTGDDDEAAAKQLLAENVDFVLVDRTAPRVHPWMETRMSSVHLRLRDAVSLAWFHPVVIGSGFALFRVAPPFDIPIHIKRRITSRVRALFLDQQPEAFAFNPPLTAVGDDTYRVIVSLRWRAEKGLKGRKLVKKMAHGSSVQEAVDKAAKRIKSDWAKIRNRVTGDRTISVAYVPNDLKEAINQMEIEIDVLYDQCELTDRIPRNLLWYVELGLEGLSLRGKGSFYYLEPNYAVHMEMKSEIIYLEKMLIKNKMKQFLRPPKKKKNRKRGEVLHESAWMRDADFRLGRFRTVNWIERPGGKDIVELYRGVPLKTIWDVTRASLVRSLELGADWLMNNQSADGQYAYKYTPTNKPGRRWTPGGNIVRHALNPYTLLMVNKIEPDKKYVESAKKGIEFTLKFLRHKGNRCVICHRDPPARYYNAKLGTVAVTILSILKLGDVADISEYDDVLKCLAEALLFAQDPNGHFWQYDVPPDHPYYGAESTIAPGEFIFALSRLYSHYKDERYKASVDRALPFYMKAWRKLLKERTKEGIYDEEHRVNLIGIVPWLVTAMNDLHMTTGDQHYADIAFEQQDWIDKEFFWFLNRSQYPDYAGAAFKVHRELPAINSCQYIEGAAAAYDLAKRVAKTKKIEQTVVPVLQYEEMRRQVVVHGMRFCLQTQFDDYASTFFLPVPEEAMGGYRYTLGHLRLRNDYSYHAMAAIAQAVEYLNPDDYPAERPLRIPPVLKELLGGLPNPERDAPRRPPEEAETTTEDEKKPDTAPAKGVGQ
ncbi:MAG: hypothetical protein QNJ97_04375 [Myxococcota bacterium]|nr:hypothetical protein [Myxococcota bacterium]